MNDSVTRVEDIESWMVAYLADLLDVPQHEIDVTRSFDRLGLDSAAAVAFTSDLGRWLGVNLDLSLMFENEDIRSVASHIRATHGLARA